MDPDQIEAAEVVLPCVELDSTLGFFVDRLGFRVLTIAPAEHPKFAVVSGHGLRLRLERGGSGAPGRLRVSCSKGAGGELTAPNGTVVELVEADPPLVIPPLRAAFVVSRLRDGSWSKGRAGMQYRDLIPDRLGGRFVASQIRIPDGGAVPDYVHFHRVRFQVIYCYRGWVRVVYEDQGASFELQAGDCVLQPPGIRHRVLECSPGMEVIEVGSPAEHETCGDPDLALPTGALDPERRWEGQRFVRHRAAQARWEPWCLEGFEARDSGIAEATGGVGDVRVVRPGGQAEGSPRSWSHRSELWFLFVLQGSVELDVEGHDAVSLGEGDAAVVPPGRELELRDASGDLELLHVVSRVGREEH